MQSFVTYFFLSHSIKGRQVKNTCIGFFDIIVCPFSLAIVLSDHLRFTNLQACVFFCFFLQIVDSVLNGNPEVDHHAIISIKLIMNLLRFALHSWF